MSRRFGRNQKRALRQAAEDGRNVVRQRDAAEWRLRNLELDLAALVPETSTLYPAREVGARGLDPERRGIEVLVKAKRDLRNRFMHFDGPITYPSRGLDVTRHLLEELKITVFTDPNPTKLGLHLRVIHGGDVASYYLSEEAFHYMLPSVLERASQDVAKQLLMALVEHKRRRMPRAVQPTAGTSGTTKES